MNSKATVLCALWSGCTHGRHAEKAMDLCSYILLDNLTFSLSPLQLLFGCEFHSNIYSACLSFLVTAWLLFHI